MAAARNGSHEMAELLINAGADVNAENFSAETALYFAQFPADDFALADGRKKVAKLLKEAGAIR